MRIAAPLLLAIVATASTAGAANLVENGTFDDDVDGWTGFADTQIVHDTPDQLGSPLSGSLRARVLDIDDTAVLVTQCIDGVVAGKTYAIGTGVFIFAGQPAAAFATAGVSWSAQPGCGGAGIGGNLTTTAAVIVQGAWGTTQRTEVAPPGALSATMSLRADVQGQVADGVPLAVLFDDAFFLEDITCAPTPTTLCLTEDRFRVTVEWKTKAGAAGYGRAVALTEDSGYFWFFNDANVELVTKLLDACPTQFGTFWFFAAGLTNVEVVIRVRDIGSDTERVYLNPLETPFAPIQDTAAFDTCP